MVVVVVDVVIVVVVVVVFVVVVVVVAVKKQLIFRSVCIKYINNSLNFIFGQNICIYIGQK